MPSGRIPKILYVEDNIIVARAYEKLLNECACDVVHCATAEEAVAKLHTEEFNLLILDLMLPGKDGINMIKETQYELWKCKIPTIVLTMINLPAITKELETRGVVAILNKQTVTPECVVETVLNTLIGAEKPQFPGLEMAESKPVCDQKTSQVVEDELSAVRSKPAKNGILWRWFQR